MEETTGSAVGRESDILTREVANNRSIADGWLLSRGRGRHRAIIDDILHCMQAETRSLRLGLSNNLNMESGTQRLGKPFIHMDPIKRRTERCSHQLL